MTDSTDHIARSDIEIRWAGILERNGISAEQADFPISAKRRILELLSDGGEGAAVFAGFFYRDFNSDESYNPGEELPATLLGLPRLDLPGIETEAFFNCYCCGSVKPGDRRRVRYEVDGIASFESELVAEPGLNLLHVPVSPQKALVYIVPHSHFDTEWGLTYEECLKHLELPNMRHRLELLQDDPAHCFCVDEECVTLPLIERSEPKYASIWVESRQGTNSR